MPCCVSSLAQDGRFSAILCSGRVAAVENPVAQWVEGQDDQQFRKWFQALLSFAEEAWRAGCRNWLVEPFASTSASLITTTEWCSQPRRSCALTQRPSNNSGVERRTDRVSRSRRPPTPGNSPPRSPSTNSRPRPSERSHRPTSGIGLRRRRLPRDLVQGGGLAALTCEQPRTRGWGSGHHGGAKEDRQRPISEVVSRFSRGRDMRTQWAISTGAGAR